ncbi:hypothetical protein E2C01_035535 [Portunus trituberculatus]|uniref:Uncharacterized protein n=1 Tax=Portunus trituberculatus TaxID=210409 RepID=A0A5B7FBQ9_PORTR|nr:hypothetical protein [Portunus trituberculatus]
MLDKKKNGANPSWWCFFAKSSPPIATEVSKTSTVPISSAVSVSSAVPVSSPITAVVDGVIHGLVHYVYGAPMESTSLLAEPFAFKVGLARYHRHCHQKHQQETCLQENSITMRIKIASVS